MSKKSKQQAQGSAEEAKQDGTVSPEEAHETGNQTTAVENEGAAAEVEETTDAGAQTTPELPELSREDQQAAIAGSMGGPDNYPYQDRTAVPLHERTQLMDSTTEASQAELNPAFTPKAEDGGPMTAENESIGTEPNVHDDMLAAAERQGGEEAVQQTQEQIDAGTEQQMDAEKVTAQAQEAAPEGIDASTGQPEGESGPVPGEGMEGRPEAEGTAGGDESQQGQAEEDNAKTPGEEQ